MSVPVVLRVLILLEVPSYLDQSRFPRPVSAPTPNPAEATPVVSCPLLQQQWWLVLRRGLLLLLRLGARWTIGAVVPLCPWIGAVQGSKGVASNPLRPPWQWVRVPRG